jgi:hypothetical protein
MKFALILSLGLLLSCSQQPKRIELLNAGADSLKSDTIYSVPECIPKDTTTASGTKIHYIARNNKFQVSWGNGKYSRIYDSSYSCFLEKNSGIWDNVPKLESETKNSLVFRNVLSTSGGANPAPIDFYSIVLPKNQSDSTFEIPFFIKCIKEYIIYTEPFTNNTLYLLNLETKKKQLIILNPSTIRERSISTAISDMKIENSMFLIEYKSLDKNDNTIRVKKKYPLEI